MPAADVGVPDLVEEALAVEIDRYLEDRPGKDIGVIALTRLAVGTFDYLQRELGWYSSVMGIRPEEWGELGDALNIVAANSLGRYLDSIGEFDVL
jgi:hypothetical protein